MTKGSISPACYPKSYSYKRVLENLTKSNQTQQETKSQAAESDYSLPPPAVAPSFISRPGDVKKTHRLPGGGRLVVLTRKDSVEVCYDLRCKDGRRVFLEKTATTASLCVTDERGKVIKTLMAEM